ncbi:hypothetical protein WICPIJ_009124 [Wickerhamomyces pijperi]|uniref:Major facilitator superfamily (MFS) profile domain-containing protein n=1 Tax=Wickerhamomyces pijperi TaxID=599730 RepID=A0A9P8PRV7_WICPI|nr:hypothetical protein WICPIJ_009124 [Wickerhamomyces pijperi]
MSEFTKRLAALESSLEHYSGSPGHLDSKKLQQLPTATQYMESQILQNHYSEYIYTESKLDPTNVLTNYSLAKVLELGKLFACDNALGSPSTFIKGAALARDPLGYQAMHFLTVEEKDALRVELENPWVLSRSFKISLVMCFLGGVTFGSTEMLFAGALIFLQEKFSIPLKHESSSGMNFWISASLAGVPYLCCFIISSFLTDPLNNRIGRRKTIFVGLVAIIFSCVWQALSPGWKCLLAARAFLGAFGIGPMAITVQVYILELSPAKYRGTFYVIWRFFQCCGYVFGSIFVIVFYHINKDEEGPHSDLKWRLMLAVGGVPALLSLFPICLATESPRWFLNRGDYAGAYESLKRLRRNDVCAAKELFYQYMLIEEDHLLYGMSFYKKLKELVRVRRNRNALLASFILTFFHQSTGIGAFGYYSTVIFYTNGSGHGSSMFANLGLCFATLLSAIPPIFLIDRFGRRKLLLWHFFPTACSVVFFGLTGIMREGSSLRFGMSIFGVYAIFIFFNIGLGSVAVPYTAESFPLYLRSLGTSLMIGALWLWKFVYIMFYAQMKRSWGQVGSSFWFAGMCVPGFFLVLWFVPETNGWTLEELDTVFDINLMDHAKEKNKSFINGIRQMLRCRGKTRTVTDDIEQQTDMDSNKEETKKVTTNVSNSTWDKSYTDQNFVDRDLL